MPASVIHAITAPDAARHSFENATRVKPPSSSEKPANVSMRSRILVAWVPVSGMTDLAHVTGTPQAGGWCSCQ